MNLENLGGNSSLPLLFVRPSDGTGYHTGKNVVIEKGFAEGEWSKLYLFRTTGRIRRGMLSFSLFLWVIVSYSSTVIRTFQDVRVVTSGSVELKRVESCMTETNKASMGEFL